MWKEQPIRPPRCIDTPCPGLRASDNPRILSYLQRTSIPGGGAKPRHVLCQKMFGDNGCMSDLSPKQMKRLLGVECALYLWENVHTTLSIHSTSCVRIIQVSETELPTATHPCMPCRELLSNKTFKNAISRPTPHPGNTRYTAHVWTEPLVQETVKRQLGIEDLFSSVRIDISVLNVSLLNFG